MTLNEEESKIEEIIRNLLSDRDACKYLRVSYSNPSNQDYHVLRETAKVIYWTMEERKKMEHGQKEM